jgi:hypothetical protein
MFDEAAGQTRRFRKYQSQRRAPGISLTGVIAADGGQIAGATVLGEAPALRE